VRVPIEPVFYERPRTSPSVVEIEPEIEPGIEPVVRPAPEPPRPERSNPQGLIIFGVAMLVGIILAFTVGHPPTHDGKKTSAGASAPQAATPSGEATAQPSPGQRLTPGAPASATTVAPPTTLTLNRTVLLEVKRDQGSKATPHFTAPGPRWTLGWAYDCTQVGGSGSFKVTILNADGTPSRDGGVDQQGAKGSSVAAYTSSGERYLSVQTPCLWALRVTT
jgi:hypothetical protein